MKEAQKNVRDYLAEIGRRGGLTNGLPAFKAAGVS
jgi:hypothetical protein